MYTLIQENNETISIKRLEDGAYIPMDEGNADYQQYLAWVAEGNTAEVELPPTPTPEEIQAQMTAVIQGMLDDKAKERNYDGIVSACTYAISKNEKFAAEGQACVEWRDAVWAKGYEILEQVKAGKIEIPTTDELLEMLPILEWPE